MIKKLFKHSGIYMLPGISSKLVGFLLLPLITHYVKPYEYGILELISITILVVSLIYTAGINSALFRSTIYKKDINKSELISTSFFFLIFTSILFLTPLILFSKNIADFLLNNKTYYYLIIILAVNSFFLQLSLVPLARLRIEEDSKKYSIFAICNIALNIILKFFFIAVLKLGLFGLVLSDLIVNLTFGLISIYFIKDLLKLRFSLIELKDLLTFGIPLIGVSLSGLILNMGDRYVLNYLSDSETVGIYSVGYRISLVVMLFVSGFQIAWPKYLFEIGKSENRIEYVKVLNNFTFLGMIIVFLVSLFSREVILLMTPPLYHGAFVIVPLVSLGVLFYGIERIICTGIHLKNKTYYQAISFIGGALLNIGLNFILIKIMGMIGAALATFLTYFAMVLFELKVSQRLYRIPYDYIRIFKTISIPFVLFIVTIFFKFSLVYLILVKIFIFSICMLIMYNLVLNNSEKIRLNYLVVNKFKFAGNK